MRIQLRIKTLKIITKIILLMGACIKASAHGGWVKYEGNPVLGAELDTGFDANVIAEGQAPLNIIFHPAGREAQSWLS